MAPVRVLTVALLPLLCLLAGPGRAQAAPQPIHLEAENGILQGLSVATDVKGYSGAGYVTGFDQSSDTLTFRFTAEAGLFDVLIRYNSPGGVKGYTLAANDQHDDGMFTGTNGGFATHRAGKVLLKAGENTLAIGKGWGWFDVDYVELAPAQVAPPARPPASLADPKAGQPALTLYAYLRDQYGRNTLSGQYSFADIQWVRDQTGKEPAVGGFDFMDYSPSRTERGANPNGQTEKVIAWVRSGGGIVSMTWHWNAPLGLIDQPGKEWWRGFYTSNSTFDVEAALADPSSEGYRLLLRDIDVIAGELKKYQDAGIPVLWRPLHESSQRGFWWGAKGPEPFVKLWRLMFQRLTEQHGLHNLIWVYTPGYVLEGDADEWYPGDQYVDVVGADLYAGRSDTMSEPWESLQGRYNGKKLLALSESGTLPPEGAAAVGVRWCWFAVWSGMAKRIPLERLKAVYQDENVITRDELPASLRPAPAQP
jgi:mannan endo-1,4-beta-mannosidase